MQEQGKRLVVAVALALLVFLGYSKFIAKQPTPPAAGSGSAAVAATGSGSTVANLGPRPTAGDDEFLGKPLPAEQTDVGPAPLLHFPAFDVQFSNLGGAIAGWRLSDERYTKVKDDQGKPTNEGQLLPISIPGAGSLQFNYRRADGTVLIPSHSTWKPTVVDANTVRYDFVSPEIQVTKTFTVVPAAYMVKLAVQTKFGQREGNVIPVLTTYGFQDPKTDDAGSARVQPRVWQSASYANGELAATAGIKIGTNAAADSSPRSARNVQWTGFMHPFLLAAIAPQKVGSDEISKHTEALDPPGLMRTDIFLGSVTVQAKDDPDTRSAVAYFGPKNFDVLDNADKVAGFETGFKETIDFGHLPLLGLSLAFIGKPLLWLLGVFYGAVGNWGVAIILLTLIVKIITLFWTTRSMRSMKAMAALSPQVQELQKKYGDDKAAAQQATMALYKQNNVSPLSGCAPMFLQIPIWSALYIMLGATGELYQAAFIPGWINDLTNTDPLHILPVLLVATMFLQARLTPQAANQPGQKMMQYGMPLMFGVMSFYFPAGLTLYIFTNTVLSSLHSIYMNKFDKKSLAIAEQLKKNKEAVAAREAAAKAAEEAAKRAPAGGGKKNGKKSTTSNGSIKALKESADEATEVAGGDAASDDDGQDDPADEALGAPATTGSGTPRARRKKRRRS